MTDYGDLMKSVIRRPRYLVWRLKFEHIAHAKWIEWSVVTASSHPTIEQLKEEAQRDLGEHWNFKSSTTERLPAKL